jgi:3-dehydroquinate dehydratase II
MLGKREPEIYGSTSLEEINGHLKEQGGKAFFTIDVFQSNSEGRIVSRIQDGLSRYAGLVINPGAYTHTSIAIRDALLILDIPIIEVHLSNIYKREVFRHKSMIADIARAQISGFGVNGYYLALKGLIELIQSAGN